MSVRYTVSGDTFVADKPRVRVDKLESAGGWDLAPDGRIVAVVPIEAPAPPPAPHTVVVLQNFFDELRRRVPINRSISATFPHSHSHRISQR